jgi:thiamine biosynthesis lipoprotein
MYFDTICQIRLFCSRSEYQASQEAVEDVFTDIETLFSPDSESYTSPRVLGLYQKAREIYDLSGGLFDISVAPLSRLWGFTDKNFRVPTPEEISKTLENVGLANIRLEDGTLQLPEGMGIDWGGIAKGYGIDLAADALSGKGISRGFINAGGDLFCWGGNPEGRRWKIGIQHPRRGGFLGVLEIKGEGAATTGDYQRFFQSGGRRYHHVFDPRTGYPATGKQSVTVVGPSTLLCDALSTALFVSEDPGEILSHYPGYGAVLVAGDGNITELGKKLAVQYY